MPAPIINPLNSARLGQGNILVTDSLPTSQATKWNVAQAVGKAVEQTNNAPIKGSADDRGLSPAKVVVSGVGSSGYSGGGGGGSASVNPNANALALLAQNYANSVKSVNDRYNFDEQNLRNDAEKELREAYINYMMNRKNAANDMARLGYTGGVTESNLARMNNNYGTIRNDINRRLDEGVREYTLKRNAELLSLLNNYNNQQMRYAL